MIKKYLYGGPGYFLPENNLLLKFKDKLYNLSRRIMATANNVKDINYDTLPSGEPLEGVAQTTYLLPRHLQKEKFLEYGYKESPGDYGLVKKAVGNRKLPVYQKNPDVISRNELQVVGNPDYTVWFGNSTEALTHAGNHPSAIYHDDLGNLYQKSWDLNDYGGGTGAYTHYSPKEKMMADIGDIIGSPVVVTTGFRPIYTLKGPEDKLANLLDTGEWKPLDAIINSYLNQKGLHIDSYKENGNNIKFLSLPEVIIKGKKQNIKMRDSIKAANARKWKHKDGGVLYIFLEGGKTSWWSKVGNFMSNSGLGEVALNALSTYTLNKLIGANSDIAKALVDKDKASKILQANLAAELEANDIQLNNVNPENPNAMSGDIVKNFIKNKLLSLKMALINLESNLEKAEIDWQTLLLKNLNTTNMWAGIGSTLMQGLGHVGLYMGNKQLTNVSNT